MTEATLARLEKIAQDSYPAYVQDGYRFTFMVCDICGRARASMDDPGRGFRINVAPITAAECDRCLDVLKNYPQVSNWVLSVLEYLKERTP